MSSPVELDPKEYVSTLELLRRIDFLSEVPQGELQSVLLSLQKQTFPAQKTILFQGEIANRLFIIRQGSVVITTRNKSEKVTLAELPAGSYFGEISLLRPTSATATATAGAEGADLIILTHDAMTELSKKMPGIHERIQQVIEARMASKKRLKETDEPAESKP